MFPPELQELVDKKILRFIGEKDGVYEWVIDCLANERPSYNGKCPYIYQLNYNSTVTGAEDDPDKFEIMEVSPDFADECMISSNDFDDIDAWIDVNIKENEHT